ncbi:MAG: hypothetical protein HRT36_05540 [Alphaproteobacteria bacterium]|nr:hypothetical protein [Alphaproteobacteria bacterium]
MSVDAPIPVTAITRDTALREAEGEIGLPRHAVEIVSTLDRHLIARKYLIIPHVGLIA